MGDIRGRAPLDAQQPTGVAVLNGLFTAVKRHRLRLAKLALLLTMLGVGGELVGAFPREVDLELDLGADHAAVRELRVAYVQEGQEVHGVRLHYPAGAPQRVRHRTRLGPGRYELQVERSGAQGGPRLETRTLDVPTEGTVRFGLGAQPAR